MQNPIQVTLTPEHERFVQAAVSSGRFASVEQVLVEALSRFIDEADEEIDDETFAALRRGEEQLARGEGRAWDDVRDELRAKYSRR